MVVVVLVMQLLVVDDARLVAHHKVDEIRVHVRVDRFDSRQFGAKRRVLLNTYLTLETTYNKK